MPNNSFIEYISERLSPYGNIRSRAMFGGYGIYCNNIIFAIVVEDELYFKTDHLLSIDFASQGSSPFTYEARGKTVSMSYWNVPIEVIEDDELLKTWFDKSMKVAKNKNRNS